MNGFSPSRAKYSLAAFGISFKDCDSNLQIFDFDFLYESAAFCCSISLHSL